MSRLARPLLVCGVLALLALVVIGLGTPLGNSDEAIYAESVRAMHRTGTYTEVTYAGRPLLQRPPWSVAAYALVARVVPGELGLRLLPAICTLLAALLLGALVARASRRPALGLAAAALAIAAPTTFVYGRICMSDPPFVLAIAALIAAVAWAWTDPRGLTASLAALGLALAAKSLAAAPFALALAPWFVVAWRRHARAGAPHARAIALGAAALLALAAPFYVIGFARHGARFWAEHVGYNLAARARGGLAGIGLPGGVAAYVVHLARADGPIGVAVLLVGPVAAAAVAARRRDAVLGLLATAALGPLVALSLLGTRLPHYLLPVIPPAAAATALLVARLVDAAPGVARFAPVIPLAAFAWLLDTASRPGFDGAAAPAPEARLLGEAARAALPADAPAYSLDWYAPAFGYYADRPWRFLVTVPRVAAIVDGVDTFHGTGVVVSAPPWPPGPFLVAAPAGRAEELGLHVDRVLAEAAGLVLVEVTPR